MGIRLSLIIQLFLLMVFNINKCNSEKNDCVREQLSDLTVAVHRAGHGSLENSIRGIRECIDNGFTEIEIDVRMTADGILVLCHDESIEYAANKRARICDLTFDDICRYAVKNLAGETLPTLSDALDAVNGKCRLLIDAKRDADAERLAKAIINEVALYQAFEWVTVQSFDDKLLSELHRLGHPFPLEKIFVLKIPGLPFVIDEGLSFFNFDKYDYISSFNIYYRTLTRSLVDKIHKKGKRVRIWSPDAPCDAKNLLVDGVITGFPEYWK